MTARRTVVRESGPSSPPPRTTLIGREDAIARVLELLDGSPLVTLFGVAGVGKTSLAVAIADAASDRFRDGVVWVDLIPATDADGVAGTLMTALGVRDAADVTPLDAIARAAAGRQMLLVLDNAEHVVAAVREMITALLRRCPQLAALVTSREPLGVASETSWLVPSLAVPDADDPPDEVTKVAAVALFCDRVRGFAPELVLSDADIQSVAAICRGLDGIPLAIEFAAARVHALPIDAIAQRLDRALGLFGEERTKRPRHMTLRAALDWSHDLLEERERVLLRRLTVFAGSFTLVSAEAICSGPDLERDAIAETLASLVDRSLVVPPEPGAEEPRYRLLETVRQYAAERLQESGEDGEYLQRHARHFVEMAEAAEPRLRGHGQFEAHSLLRSEYTNLRAILQRSTTKDSLSPLGLRMTAALGGWWWWFGQHLRDARTWLDLSAAMPRPNDPREAVVWARAMLQAGVLAWNRAELEQGASRLEAAFAVLDGVEPWYAAFCRMLQSFIAGIGGSVLGATEAMADARRRFEEIGDRWGPAVLTSTEATAARFFQGDVPGAELAFESALAQMREIGDEHVTWAPLHNLGHIAAHRGDEARATAFFEEALDVTLRYDDRLTACACIAGLGHAAVVAKEPLRAAELLAAAGSLLDRMGSQHQPQNQLMYDRAATEARAVIGEPAFTEASERGRRLTFHDAVALAKGGHASERLRHRLTRREGQVAQLVGEGLSNRQIAERLSISPHTAERHVERILAKLEMSSRVEIATWVVRARG